MLCKSIGCCKLKIPENLKLTSSPIGEPGENLQFYSKTNPDISKLSEDVICIGCGVQKNGETPLTMKPGKTNRFLRYYTESGNEKVGHYKNNALITYTSGNPGDSGGGIIDEDGKYIGTIISSDYSKIKKNEFRHDKNIPVTSVPVETIREFLKNKGYSRLYNFILILFLEE